MKNYALSYVLNSCHATIAWFKYSDRLYDHIRYLIFENSSPLTESLDLFILEYEESSNTNIAFNLTLAKAHVFSESKLLKNSKIPLRY